MNKKALITGITGQDGAYLASHLINLGYEVHGLVRRTSSNELYRLEYLTVQDKIKIHDCDLNEFYCVNDIIKNEQFNEIYNLAAQSFVGSSFSNPQSTVLVNSNAVLNLLESIRLYSSSTRFYQASTSEMFGLVQETPQSEKTPFYPRSPYGVSKLFSHWMVKNYRESYNLFFVSGILFNHESPLRGREFVTKKITTAVAEIALGLRKELKLGNLEAKRDWGFAGDYVIAMHKMLQQAVPNDFVIGTGMTTSVRSFVELAFKEVNIDIDWNKQGLDEEGVNRNTGQVLVTIDPKYFRPSEVDLLIADSSLANSSLNWSPSVSLEDLVKMMVEYDLKVIKAAS